MEEANRGANMVTPAAIIIAGFLIAGAIIYSGGSGISSQSGRTGQAAIGDTSGGAPSRPSSNADSMKAVSSSDHILGSSEAPVKIVEFSDTECPFCKRFHETMQQALEEYPGKIAWAYRHFPLDSIHSKARKEAEATECANELGGNEKFWAYLDKIFEITPSNNQLSLDELPRIAEQVGLNRKKFEECLASGRHAKRVADDLLDATNAGASGTPYSVVVAPNGQRFVISGAQPYSAVKQLVDSALLLK